MARDAIRIMDGLMEVRTVMTRKVVTVDMDDTLRTIYGIFKKVEFHHVPVVERARLSGVISDHDILRYMSPFVGTPSQLSRDEATMNKRAHQIMSRRPVTIMKHQNVHQAIALLLEKKVSCLPVVSSQGHVEGIVTWRDLMKACLMPADKTESGVPS